MHKPVKLDIPYPSADTLCYDPQSAQIFLEAYATQAGEYAAISQYIYHHFSFFNLGLGAVSDILENIALCEMAHFEMLGAAIDKMGGNPVLSVQPPHNFFEVKEAAPQTMILDNITAERASIDNYLLILKKIKNEQAAKIIKRIIMDEELHLEVLNSVLTNVLYCQERTNSGADIGCVRLSGSVTD